MNSKNTDTKFILLGRAMQGIFMITKVPPGIQSLVLLSPVSLRCTFYCIFHLVGIVFSLGLSIAPIDSSSSGS